MKSTTAKHCLFAAMAVVVLCAGKPKRTPTPTPAPAPAPIPYRPIPPLWASPNVVVPPIGPDGKHVSVNTGITPTQRTWNFRSAYNVAALDCGQPQYVGMIPAYRAFLRKHARGLAAANRGVDAEYRARHGAGFVRHRESYMTKVYNFYAFPPTLGKFCDAALLVSQEGATIKLTELNAFAARSLPKLDQVLEDFYVSYEQWQRDAAAWDARYAPRVAPLPMPSPSPTPVRGK